MCFFLFPKQTSIIFLYGFHWMVFLMDEDCVLCEVWAEYLYRQFLRYVIRNLRKLGLKKNWELRKFV
jgi:hypothetical protein